VQLSWSIRPGEDKYTRKGLIDESIDGEQETELAAANSYRLHQWRKDRNRQAANGAMWRGPCSIVHAAEVRQSRPN
jgi:hypothetical protein